MDTGNSFRDKVATIDSQGHRILLFPKQPKGKFYNARTLVSLLWLGLFFGIPFMKINGYPVLLLDIANRKFSVLGQVFWPQDFHIFALFFISLTIFLILFTVVYGRIFCGWVCPQTIFLEMVYRKVEYWIEGTASQQKALNSAPWGFSKILKKGTKQLIFLVISAVLVHGFVMYFVDPLTLFRFMGSNPSENPAEFGFMLAGTLILYGIYARFREQVCTLVCPYGRLQGVLLDEQSIIITYDHRRGEPRGKGKREDKDNLGDCIDCNQCVNVCPTGIDIRNGTQLECVNCTACIDACDEVMRKIKKPEGLIRYATYREVENNEPFKFTVRMGGYTAVLALITIVLTYSIFSRTAVETSVLRVPGVLYQSSNDGFISNLYNYKVVNKTHETLEVQFHLKSPEGGAVQVVGANTKVPPEALTEGSFFIKIPDIHRNSNKIPVVVEISSKGKIIEEVTTNFIGKDQ